MSLEVAPTDEKLAACSHEWVHKSYQCTSFEESEKVYDEWAKVYDSTMDPDKYQAPIGLVNHLKKNNLVASDDSVVDIGCGTGLLGKYMKEMGGFTNIDVIDQSQGMLDEAAKKGVYGKLVKGTWAWTCLFLTRPTLLQYLLVCSLRDTLLQSPCTMLPS